jgi:thioredoxin 1
MATTITAENFEKEVLKSDIPVVVDVYATWCGPCQQVAPIFDELAKELLGKYKLVKINIDDAREIAIKYNVSSIPTFIFIKKGEIVGREMGYMSKIDLKKKIEEIFG